MLPLLPQIEGAEYEEAANTDRLQTLFSIRAHLQGMAVGLLSPVQAAIICDWMAL